MARRLVNFSTEGTIFSRESAPRPAQPPAPAIPAKIPHLVLEGIRAEGTPPLAGLDLQLAQGELLSLLGPAGAGKSAVIDIVAGFHQPEGGLLLLKGENQARLPVWKRDIGFVSTEPDLLPDLTVLANAALALEARGVAKPEREERAAAMLERWGIPPALAGAWPAALPPGRQMRVALARAVVHGPALLLLDDPLRGLEGEEREALAADLPRLAEELDLTVLHATQDATLALGLSDRVAVLAGGRLLQLGTPRDVYDSPADPAVAALTGPCNRLPGTVLAVEEDGCHVRLDCGPEAWGAAVIGPAGSPVPGGRCVLVIRPEQLAVAPLPPEEMGEDAVPARLLEARFAGDHLRLRLAVGEGGVVIAHRPPGLVLPALGGQASLAWGVGAARIYPA